MDAIITKHGRQRTSYYIEKLEGMNLERFFEKKTKYSAGTFTLSVICGDAGEFTSYDIEFGIGRKSLRWERIRMTVTTLSKKAGYYHNSVFEEVA
jgi:hypothetical protein